MPRYSSTSWDVKTVLDYLDVLFPMENQTLKELTLKTCTMLLSLVTGQRGHALDSLSVNDGKMEENKCLVVVFPFSETENYKTRPTPRASRNKNFPRQHQTVSFSSSETSCE